ncbi:MAG: hypothetical protein R3282_05295, partial [Rhodothermales bacterium]|nr:hypothetical protein [Rhodothermales bacterium]
SAVLDLGSGFTSVTARVYGARRPGIVLHSVDDSPKWLARTAAFLRRQDLAVGTLVEWSEFRKRTTQPYDLIIHDLGSMELREKALRYVLVAASCRKTIVVLDDMHKSDYRSRVLSRLHALPSAKYYDLDRYTVDQFQRFCGLVCDVVV